VLFRSSTKPVSVRFSVGEKLFFAENENLGIFASGDTPFEAVSDFSDQLVYFYEFYRDKTSDELTGDALRIKGLFDALFREQVA